MELLHILEKKISTSKVDLLDKIWMKVKPEDKKDKIIENVVSLTQNSLNAAVSTLLLLHNDNDKQELYFQFAEGVAARQLKRLHVGRKSSLIDWVIKNRKPTLVNNIEKNRIYYKLFDDATGFTTKHAVAAPIFSHGKVIGAVEALNRIDGALFSKNELNTMIDVVNIASLTFEGYLTNTALMHSYKHTVRALVSLVDAKETTGHSKRMMDYALIGARELGLSRKQQQSIEYAAILHDIGKLSIADEILNKADPLTDEEWVLMKKHPIVGYDILKDIPFLKEASQLILLHHERYDGGGYPQGLHGNNIPIGARLIAVADAFDNMTTERNYRRAMTAQQAFGELYKHAGDQFCPTAVKAFNTGYVRTRLTRKRRTIL